QRSTKTCIDCTDSSSGKRQAATPESEAFETVKQALIGLEDNSYVLLER
ncbi:MAG: hypothetical protein F6K28_50670, partial [Microcoleus sp. SIO2G3]|nr:hypothetical protein [Microcoleus sp. SIO2G3]